MQTIKVLDPTADDVKHFGSLEDMFTLDHAVAMRIVVERAIIRKLCTDAIAKGYSISVFDGEEHPVRKSQDLAVIMDAVCACDEEWLSFYHESSEKKSKHVGDVSLVYGNDGPDVIADYHTVLEPLLDDVNKYADTLYV